MSNGGAQFASFGPFWDATNNVDYEDIKIYAYAAGAYSVAKSFWTAEGKTGAVTSRQGDDTGTVSGYFDGDYNFEIKSSDDVTTIVQIPNFKITSDSATLWEGAQGLAYPAAASSNEGMMFAKIDGSKVIRGIAISNGTAWTEFYTANSGGSQTIDELISKTMPVYNVKHPDWGALGDGGTDDTSSIQAAIDAIEATTYGGVLYFPAGTYIISGALTVNNTNIRITGDGPHISSIAQKGAFNGFTMTFSSALSHVTIDNLSLVTNQTAPGDAINANWPSGGTTERNFTLSNVDISPIGVGGDYWTNGLVLSDTVAPTIEGLNYQGLGSSVSSTSAITISDAAGNIYIDSGHMYYCATGIIIQGTTVPAIITGNHIGYVNIGVNITTSSAKSGFVVTSNRINAFTRGVVLGKVTEVEISGNTLLKHTSSSGVFYGVELTDTNNDCNITGNIIRDYGVGGTFYGVLLTSGTGAVINSNTIKGGSSVTLEGIQVAAGILEFTMNGNRISDVTTGINVVAGASENYIITSNNLEGCTTTISDNGTGVVKVIRNNSPLNAGSGTVASATTITCDGSTDFWALTGTTDVTTITASWAGRMIVLQAAGSVTIKDSTGNLNLTGDFAMTATDTLSLICDGTSWLQTSLAVL